MSAPKVSIVLLAYLQSNAAYLAACLRAIDELEYPKERIELIIVSPWVEPDISYKVVRPPMPGSFSASVNAGVGASDPDSEYIFMLSDDTLPTMGSLKNMVAMGEAMSDCLIGPLSNCDNGWRYIMNIPHLEQTRYYKTAKIVRECEDMIKAQSPIQVPVILPVPLICFYAFLIKRSTWNKIGLMDESFNMGYEDSDYCMRALAAGVQPVIAMNALIYHAGGGSESIITDDMRGNNQRLFEQKWAKK